MTWLELVDRLCVHAGIEPFYHDIGGTRHDTTLETKVLVLSALGFDVRSVRAAGEHLRKAEERSWRRALPPFLVRTAHEHGFDLDLFTPANDAERNWSWLLTLETGENVRGSFRPADIALLGAREVGGKRIEHRRLVIRGEFRPGYHRLRVDDHELAEARIALAPTRCYLPDNLERPDGRVWGLTAHLYTLRSQRNWGIGDFGDLATLGRIAGAAGVSAIAVNPFHALFPQTPDAASPYSPSSRMFLNPIYIDIEAVPHAEKLPEIAAGSSNAATLRGDKLVNYTKVSKAKRAAFEVLYRHFQTDLRENTPLARDVARFAAEGGDTLKRFAVFSALEDEHGAQPWHQWPEALRNAASAGVQDFVRDRADRVGFHLYLQYLADRQLAHAADAARAGGAGIGFVRDLALGIDPDGADTWAMGETFAQDLRCGAPPDPFNPRGQEWGVLPLNPLALRENFEPFANMLAANMRHAGGLRIDHVIGLQRQFLVPLGSLPAQGCYVRFPFEELIGILALESQRHRVIVIGEDLGTVPAGFRDRMAQVNALGCAILYFEKTGDGFKAPGDYRQKSAASVTTHDLPTLIGYWEGRDIDIRQRIGISPEEEAEAARRERGQDRRQLLDALRQAGLFDSTDGEPIEMTSELRDAIHSFLASSWAQFFLAQIDDLTGETDPINVPGTIDTYPNWRRKLSMDVDDPRLAAALDSLRRICIARGRITLAS